MEGGSPGVDKYMEGVLVAVAVPGHLQSTAVVPLSRALNPQMLTKGPAMNPGFPHDAAGRGSRKRKEELSRSSAILRRFCVFITFLVSPDD